MKRHPFEQEGQTYETYGLCASIRADYNYTQTKSRYRRVGTMMLEEVEPADEAALDYELARATEGPPQKTDSQKQFENMTQNIRQDRPPCFAQ